MGVSSAVVAVFDRALESVADTTPSPARRPRGDPAKTRSPRRNRATRRSRPYLRNASARRKEPRKRKITGLA
jgi:hypothetical protein